MTLEIFLLATGSSGNCALIRGKSGADVCTVVLDCGIALRRARDLAAGADIALGRIDAVLLSHHHADHASKVVPLAARAGAPLCADPTAVEQHPACAAGERRRRGVELRPYRAGTWMEFGPLRVLPVRLSHDAEPTHGFVFECAGRRAGFFTDLGTTTPLTPALLEGMELLVLEANHDSTMLREGRYPPHLKNRVGGDRGHLNNGQTAEILARGAPSTLRSLTLAHLSEHNNLPTLAVAAAAEGLRRAGRSAVELRVAPKRGLLTMHCAG